MVETDLGILRCTFLIIVKSFTLQKFNSQSSILLNHFSITIQIYGDNHDIRMHDVVEVIGIYTFDPEQPVSSKSQLPLNSDHDMVTDHE